MYQYELMAYPAKGRPGSRTAGAHLTPLGDFGTSVLGALVAFEMVPLMSFC